MRKTSRGKIVPVSEVLGSQDRHKKELKPSPEAPSKSSSQKTVSITTFIPILILLIVSFCAYFNALSGDFVYDDKLAIVGNPWVRDIKNIPAIFSNSVWSFQPGIVISNYYRPLNQIVYMLNYYLFGMKPREFHLINIFFHCGVSFLVFLVLRNLLPGRRNSVPSYYLSPPLIAAMLFATHPIHTEAVTWIAGLPDVAFTLFYLLSLYFYLLFREGLKRGYLLSILSFSVATLFKEPALTLPILLIAYDCLVKKSDETILAGIKRYIPYVAVSGVYLLVRYYALRGFAPMEAYADLSTYQLIINVFPLFREYLTSMLWPFDLNLVHTFHPISSLFEEKGMISVVVAGLFFIAAVAAYKKNRLLFFSLLLVVVPLLPVFYIKAIAEKPFAERYLYLPSVGYVFLLAIFLSWAREKLPHVGKIIMIVFIVTVGVYTVGTMTRNKVWQDEFKLWTDTARKSPDSALAHKNLGNAYASRGQLDKAIAEFQTTLRLDPDVADAHNNLGFAYASQGQLDKAIAEYQTALRLEPDYADAHNNLGNAYASQGQVDKAMAEYQTAFRMNPDDAVIHNNLGLAFEPQGQFDRAIAEFQTALRLKPDDAMVHNNLGFAYASQGQVDRAIAEFQTALRLKPDYAEAHINLGNAYASQSQLDRAIAEYQTALQLKPDAVKAHNNLANAYKSQGQLDKAMAEFQIALRLKPDNNNAHNNLGNAYKSQSQLDGTMAEFQTALRLKPDNAVVHYNLGNDYKSQGQLDKAIAEYKTALRLKPDYEDAHNNLGNAYKSQGQLDKAIAEFQTALRLKPDFAVAHYNLGLAYKSQGQLDKAIAEFQTALQLKPDFAVARQHLDEMVSRRH